jgi:hypothetical protein
MSHLDGKYHGPVFFSGSGKMPWPGILTGKWWPMCSTPVTQSAVSTVHELQRNGRNLYAMLTLADCDSERVKI